MGGQRHSWLFHEEMKRTTHVGGIGGLSEMRVNTQSRPVGLREAPENVFGSFVDVGPACSVSAFPLGMAIRVNETDDPPVYSGK